MQLFKGAESILHEGMQGWRALARSMRAKRILDGHPTPQLSAPAWNQVMLLAIYAESPTAAWHLFCVTFQTYVDAADPQDCVVISDVRAHSWKTHRRAFVACFEN